MRCNDGSPQSTDDLRVHAVLKPDEFLAQNFFQHFYNATVFSYASGDDNLFFHSHSSRQCIEPVGYGFMQPL